MRLSRLFITLALAAIGLSVVGCATGPQYTRVWSKPNQKQGEFAKDKYECLQEAQQRKGVASGGYCVGYYCEPASARSTVSTNDTLYQACMEARGWSLEKRYVQSKRQSTAAYNSSVSTSGQRTYPVTGIIVEVNEDVIVILKGRDKWEIGRDATTINADDLEVGSLATIYYTLNAETITVRNRR